MVGLLAPTLVALAAGLCLGGSFQHMSRLKIRWWPAILGAFAVELLLYNPPINAQGWAMQVGPWVWIATRLMILSALVVNARSGWAWWIAATGVALNTLVVALNGGHMPQSTEAAVAVWGATLIDPTRLQNVVPIDTNTRLVWFADIFAEPTWIPRPNVVSLGDVLLALGVAGWVFGTVTERERVSLGRRKDG